jgi:hypothetical protein
LDCLPPAEPFLPLFGDLDISGAYDTRVFRGVDRFVKNCYDKYINGLRNVTVFNPCPLPNRDLWGG